MRNEKRIDEKGDVFIKGVIFLGKFIELVDI